MMCEFYGLYLHKARGQVFFEKVCTKKVRPINSGAIQNVFISSACAYYTPSVALRAPAPPTGGAIPASL
jgi:hypothetical protein